MEKSKIPQGTEPWNAECYHLDYTILHDIYIYIYIYIYTNLNVLFGAYAYKLIYANIQKNKYSKSTIFGVLLYLANLANCVFSLIYVAPTYVIVR